MLRHLLPWFAAIALLGCPSGDDDDDTGDDDTTADEDDDDSADDDDATADDDDDTTADDDDSGTGDDDDTTPAYAILDLADATARILGVAEEDRSGLDVTAAGDIDGDGFDDFLVAAHAFELGQPDTGGTFVFHGPVTGDHPLTDAQGKLIGESTGDQSGAAISGGGDVNGDGVPDVLVGAPKEDTNGSMAGAAYVVHGSMGNVDLEDAQTKLVGMEMNDFAGIAVSFVPDMDGDGDDELLIGAPGRDVPGNDAGAAYLILAPPAGYAPLDSADAELRGEDEHDNAGAAVAASPDMDGDGRGDLIIGAYGEGTGGGDLAGAVYLVHSLPSGVFGLGSAEGKLVGEAPLDFAGLAVASAGDLDGDGLGDVLVGAPGESSAFDSAGAVYAVLGPVSGTVSLADAHFKLTGEGENDKLGTGVAGIGDLDGDGRGDLLAGAPQQAGVGGGAAYVVFGHQPGVASVASAAWKLVGETDGDEAGTSVGLAGDVDGDGFVDLLVGAWRYEANGPDSGASYLISGAPLQ
jgi:hypothetical protein